MPNRQAERKIIGRFELFGNPVCTYETWLLPEVPGEPACHSFSSVLWQIVKGRGWVVYQQKDENWTLGYLWPGQNWHAYIDHAYFFLPVSPMLCEVTCFYEQFNLTEELIFTGLPAPQEVIIHSRGELTTRVCTNWIELTNRHTRSRVSVGPEYSEQIENLAMGGETEIIAMVNLAKFFAQLERTIKFDPRIIYPYRQKAGSDPWVNEERQLEQFMKEQKIKDKTKHGS